MSLPLNQRTVTEALAALRAGFEADGGDLAVDVASPERVVVRLVLTTETCEDCIVPTPMLQRMISTTLRKSFPDLRELEVVDPRA